MNDSTISIIVQAPADSDKEYALPSFGKKIIENTVAEVSTEVIGKNIINLVKKFDHLLTEDQMQMENLQLDSVELNCIIGADGSIDIIGHIGMQISSSIKIKLVKKN